MTPNILIDMVNTTVFKESEWIGANKEYHDVPTHVSSVKRDCLPSCTAIMRAVSHPPTSQSRTSSLSGFCASPMAKEETEILNLTCAALALATDEMMTV